MNRLFFCLFFCLSITVSHFNAFSTQDLTSFEVKELLFQDNMDFAGQYPILKNINIDASRKKNVMLNLSGSYPSLTNIDYHGSFGVLNAMLTGDFSSIETASLVCTSCTMNIDLSGTWSNNSKIVIQNKSHPMTITLPKDIGVIVKTKTSLGSKILLQTPALKKKGFGISNKHFFNDKVESSDVVIEISLSTSDRGLIVLK